MSAPPPDRNSPPGNEAGIEVGATDARGAQRTGRAIWILAISLGAAVILLLGYTLIHAPRMGAISHPQPRDVNSQDISTFNTPAGSARQAPPGSPSTETNSQ